eukprot:TRINITY_DN19630_c0_g1_i1.p2 TRINITY_DN19630_c0_g1~~TRINITY_DN19630_c0_g1_i1.p2  ORF type:complete len:187 (+),score=58.71 TRINITY_DN19630_c0_g1_i1:193-753(+)
MYMCSEVEVVLEADDAGDPDAIDLTDTKNVLPIYNHPSQQLANAASGFAVEVDGVAYPSAHHYWCCAKFMEDGAHVAEEQSKRLAELRDKIRATPESDAAEQVATYTVVEPVVKWDDAAKRAAALVGMRAKFTQHKSAHEQLLATKPKKLVFLDQDTWAGVDNSGGIPKGRNALGEVLEQIRTELS